MYSRLLSRKPGTNDLVSSFPLLAAAIAALPSCAHHAVVDDGSSVSFGWPRTGILINPARLPTNGVGYYSPERWETRGLRYGTDETVSALVWLGRELAKEHPGSAFAVADLSLPAGGPSRWHRSHQHGRDIDIPFMIRSRSGVPLRTNAMTRFNGEGQPVTRGPRPARGERPTEIINNSADFVFDVERNWTLVRLLLENPIAEVQYIFVSDLLKQRLIEHGVSRGESADILARASYLLHQPSDSAAHNDHFHVRVFCAQSDMTYGCRDAGTLQWLKKDYKYSRRHRSVGTSSFLDLVSGQASALPAALSGH